MGPLTSIALFTWVWAPLFFSTQNDLPKRINCVPKAGVRFFILCVSATVNEDKTVARPIFDQRIGGLHASYGRTTQRKRDRLRRHGLG